MRKNYLRVKVWRSFLNIEGGGSHVEYVGHKGSNESNPTITYIAQYIVMERRKGRWQDMPNVCDFCPRGLKVKTGRPKRLKLEQRIELARRYHAGETPKVLAEAFGVSRRHVTRLAKEEHGDGVAVRDPSERVSFRASQSELAAFEVEWQERGYANRSQALNAMLRGRCGFLDVPRDLVGEFASAWRQSKDVSDAGLALAKAVHRGKLAVSSEDRALLIELVDLTQKMSRELGRMKEVARVQRHQDWPKMKEKPSVKPDAVVPFERAGSTATARDIPVSSRSIQHG